VPLRQLQARLSSELARASGLLRDWSERLAADASRPSRAAAADDVDAPRPAPAPDRGRTPPEHWLEVVRSHAPDLLTGGGIRVTSGPPGTTDAAPAEPVAGSGWGHDPFPGPSRWSASDEPATDRRGPRPAAHGDHGPDRVDPARTGGPSSGGTTRPGPSDDAGAPPATGDGALRRAGRDARHDGASRATTRARRLVRRGRVALGHALLVSTPDADADATVVRGAGESAVGPGPDGWARAGAADPTTAAPAPDPAGGPANPGLPVGAAATPDPRAADRAAARPAGRAGPTSSPNLDPGRRASEDDHDGGDPDQRTASTSGRVRRRSRAARADATTASDADRRRRSRERAAGRPATGDDDTARAPVGAAASPASDRPAPASADAAPRSPAAEPLGVRRPDPSDSGPPARDRRPEPARVDANRHDARDGLDPWPSLPTGSADPRARDRHRRPAPAAVDDRWPALPDEDEGWPPGSDAPAPAAEPGHARVLAGRIGWDGAADLDAEQRGR
jgi:hypothetical protein